MLLLSQKREKIILEIQAEDFWKDILSIDYGKRFFLSFAI